MSGAAAAEFGYDGDGRRIWATTGITTTVFVGSYFEWNAASEEGVSYYYAGATRLAIRTGGQAAVFFVSDHLGSTNKLVDPYGAPLTGERQLYMPWGEKRLNTSISLTRVGYTGQYDQAEIGLMFYQARWYDANLNRWASPDTIIPDYYNPLDFDRYQYVRSNPLKYVDPTGHAQVCADGDEGGDCGQGANLNQVYEYFAKYGEHRGLFAEYYAKLYNYNKIAYDLYNKMFPNGVLDVDDYNIYLNTLQPYSQDLDLTYSAALNHLPQKDFNLASTAPEFIVCLGTGIMGWVSSGVISSGTILVSTPSGALVPVPDGWQPTPARKK